MFGLVCGAQDSNSQATFRTVTTPLEPVEVWYAS